MKYTEAQKLIEDFGKNVAKSDTAETRETLRVQRDFLSLVFMVEIFGCLDQISVHTRDLAKTQAALLENFKQRANGK